MARTLFGGSPADVIAQVSVTDGDFEPATGTLTAWNAASGGTQITDLQTFAGAGISVVTPDAVGRVLFYGPDSYTAAIWLEDSLGNRWRIDPADIATRAGTPGADGADGADGAPGAPGAAILTGTTAPSGATGAVGDVHFRSNGDVSKKTGASTWTVQFNITPTLTLANAPAGSVFVNPLDGTINTDPAMTRPSARTDIFFKYRSTVLCASMIAGDEWDAL